MNIAKGEGRYAPTPSPSDRILIVTKKFYYFLYIVSFKH